MSFEVCFSYRPPLAAFCSRPFGHTFNAVVGGFKERNVGTKVHGDLVATYCSFSENKLTESETSLALQRSSPTVQYDGLCARAYSVTTPTVHGTKFLWRKISSSKVKSRNSRKYCATNIWSYTVIL